MAQGWEQYPAHGATNGNAGWGEPAGNPAVASDPLPPAKAKAGEGKRLRLENGAQIRREMVKVYRGMKVGEIDTSKGSKLIYALTELSRAIERETVEKLTERLGFRLIQSQNAKAVARATPDRKLAASLS